ncbi:hypothetical protein [Secundilactobacillus collinoides]|uniref:hypothetical protein n=1 Tax=Secundilactobacillus collinoides TaxID=33960 RepID=UPI00158567A7|nr:hypothetical protein [Secundilactobacillus collinoides]
MRKCLRFEVSKIRIKDRRPGHVAFAAVSSTSLTQAHAATTATVVSESSMTPATYVRASSSGATYNISTSGTTATFSSATHYLKNYPSTTWEATKKMTLKKIKRQRVSLLLCD